MNLDLEKKIRRINELQKQSRVGISRIIDPLRRYSYLSTKKNILLRPTRIYGLLNYRCNEKCLSCGHWCKDEITEMDTNQWTKTLGELRDFIGPFHINFSGGEPFIRNDIYDILQFCADNEIVFGICTNGSAITEKGAHRLCEMRLYNYNTSLDGATPETHNYLRGHSKAWDFIFRGIRNIRQAGKNVGYVPPIVVKPTVNKRNMRELSQIVRMAREEGWAAVNFQPMGQWTDATKPGKGLWIDEEDLPEFENIIEELIEMRHQGYPIWTPDAVLRQMLYHFRGTEPPGRRDWCSIGMTNFTIHADGNVILCDSFPSVGNVTQNTVKEIWFSPKTERLRQKMTYCKRLCLENCRVERSLKDQMMIFNILRQGRQAPKNDT